MSDGSTTRREILKTAAAIGTAAVARPLLGQQRAPSVPPTTRPAPTISIQMSAAPLAREDLDRLFDDMQARAGVNTLLPFIYTQVARTAGLPEQGFRGGNYAIPHMQYYKDTNLTYEDMRGTEFGDVDVLARTIDKAKKHGIKTYAWVLENNERAPGPKWEAFYEMDFNGRRVNAHPGGPCYNNPLYRAFTMGLVDDYTHEYPIDGVMWSSERQGGLWNALGAWHHGERSDPTRATCFCEFCQTKAKAQGINVDRAKTGFAELAKYVQTGRQNQRPRDGYFVAFMRLLQKYPELLQWENLWIESRYQFMRDIRARVKAANASLPVGWHIWHNVSFSPFHRAEIDYAEIAKFSDYIKPVLYSNAAGERIKSFADSVGENVFGDIPQPQRLDMLYKMLDYPNEAPYDKVLGTGLSPDYVMRETKRCVDDVTTADHPVEVWPGIDIDVPVPAGASRCTPESVKATVLASFKGGAKGLVLSRNYSEMRPETLSGVGVGLKELGLM